MKRLSLTVFLIGSTAWGLDLRTSVTEQRSFLHVSAETSQLALDRGSISGQGIKLAFDHSPSKQISTQVFVNTAMGGKEEGLQTSFTGFGGYAFYSLWGSCCKTQKSLVIDGKNYLSEFASESEQIRLGVGLDQLFLNGNKSVYSASGVGIAVDYRFSLFQHPWIVGLRQSILSSNQNSVQGTFLSFGAAFPL